MYAFRKPFSAGTFEGHEVFGLGLKTVLVLSQLCGYMLSKFAGVKLVSEMPRSRRAVTMIGLVVFAELALVGFALFPQTPIKVVMLFLNGLPLGLIFGLVLAYLEGRRHTEALAAGLCASFIVASGIVKSVGRWLVEVQGFTEFQMPYVTGLIFFLPMLLFVWMLERTPEPNEGDRVLRSERPVMTSEQRWVFFRAYFPGLLAFLLVYVLLTVIRTMRDDFGVEIWQALGVDEKPEVFTQSETIVAIAATALNGMAICVVRNLTALRAAVWLMCLGFITVGVSAIGQLTGYFAPFVFMVGSGIGLYIPYVAFHTTVFERLIAASRRPGNLGFLMYLADSIGYLGYAVVVLWNTFSPPDHGILVFFRYALLVTSVLSVSALLFGERYFRRELTAEATAAKTQ